MTRKLHTDDEEPQEGNMASEPSTRPLLLDTSITQLVFCSGMLRSGSTWSYNVCRYLLEHSYGDERVAKGYVGEREFVEAVLAGSDQKNKNVARDRDIVLLKFHFPTPRLIELVASGQARNIYTVRNPLNALASQIEFFKKPFKEALNGIVQGLQAMDEWRRHDGTLLVRFDDLTAAPHTEIARIAIHLGLDVDETLIAHCAEANSYEAMKRLSEDMAAWPQERLTKTSRHTFDPVTLLHVGHAPQGRARDWRKVLDPQQAATARDALQPWLDEAKDSQPAS